MYPQEPRSFYGETHLLIGTQKLVEAMPELKALSEMEKIEHINKEKRKFPKRLNMRLEGQTGLVEEGQRYPLNCDIGLDPA